jgi:hypothetical protein
MGDVRTRSRDNVIGYSESPLARDLDGTRWAHSTEEYLALTIMYGHLLCE